jgi:mannose-6-phosphate isomerase-like protein (cupin superfamily)
MCAVVALLAFANHGASRQPAGDAQLRQWSVVRDADVAVEQPGPQSGGGLTTGYPYFEQVQDMSFAFRKRALHPGSAIGLHRQDQDEVFYIVSGNGEYTLDGRTLNVGPGTALLTRTGSTHALRQVGQEDLVVIIAHPRVPQS